MHFDGQGESMAYESSRWRTDWRRRVIFDGRMNPPAIPKWLGPSYTTLRSNIMSPTYPCFFGTRAENRGEMFYSYVPGKDLSSLPATMAKFAELSAQPAFEKNNMVIFFEPDATPLTHHEYHAHFWHTLQYLHNHDCDPGVLQHPEPSDPAWEFSFGRIQMFVVCACPSFQARHSRNLGPGMVLLFQPRSVFIDKITNQVVDAEARNKVRRRLLVWDDLPPHPDLGFYGDPKNLEWKQYFLPDDNTRAANKCPFISRAAATASGVNNRAASVLEIKADRCHPPVAGNTAQTSSPRPLSRDAAKLLADARVESFDGDPPLKEGD